MEANHLIVGKIPSDYFYCDVFLKFAIETSINHAHGASYCSWLNDVMC